MARWTDRFAQLWAGPRRGAPHSLAGLMGPGEEKASRVGAVIAMETLGRPVWSPRDYHAFAREGYMQNPIVYRSVRMISEAAASIPLLLYEGAHEHETHPLLDLIRQPNAIQSSADFFESWFGFLLVAGNAYAEAVVVNDRVRELHALRPDRMKVIPGPEGWPEGFEYTANGRSVRFAADAETAAGGVSPILHMKLFHPAHDHYGFSPIEAAAAAIDIHNTAAGWNKALLDNSARPSGALVYGNGAGRLTAEQFERLKAELEANFQGAKHAGRPLLLEGGLDWKPLSLSPRDMDFIEAKNAAARDIALAIGVPPMLLGIPGDNTYSNYQEASRAFWRQTVLPLVHRTAQALGGWLGPAFGGGLELKPDLDGVAALVPEREALWARLNAASFLTLNEKREAAGYTPLEDGKEERSFPFECAPLAGRFTDQLLKYRPDQPRVPRGQPDGGQWTDEGLSGEDRRRGDGETRIAQARGGGRGRPGGLPEMTPAQAARYEIAEALAKQALRRVRDRDPDWKPTPSLIETAEGAIRAREGELAEASARLRELLRDAIPNTNPDWGVNRLRKELIDRGFVLISPAKRGKGIILRNFATEEEVRIMELPKKRFRTDPTQKHLNRYYYRYRVKVGRAEGEHITIPDSANSGD